MRPEIRAVDALAIDPFHHLRVTRPQPHTVPGASGDDTKRRAPTSRADDRDLLHLKLTVDEERCNDDVGKECIIHHSSFRIHRFI